MLVWKALCDQDTIHLTTVECVDSFLHSSTVSNMQYSLTVYQILFIAYSEKKCNKIVKSGILFILFIYIYAYTLYL